MQKLQNFFFKSCKMSHSQEKNGKYYHSKIKKLETESLRIVYDKGFYPFQGV